MSRSRNIKPGFFTNEELAEIEPLGRILFAGLWTIADREGRLEDRPKRIKIETLPYDDCNVDFLLKALNDKGFIVRYQVNDEPYIQIINFSKHQNPHKNEKPSEIPAPDLHHTSTVQEPCGNGTDSIQKPCDNSKSLDQVPDINRLVNEESSEINSSKDYGTSTVQAPYKNSTAQVIDGTTRADSFNLIPDSLNQTNDSICAREDEPVDNFSDELDESAGDDNPDFMNFWNAYPKRMGVPRAMEAWKTIMETGISPKYVVSAARKYALEVKANHTEMSFVKMPHNFLLERKFYEYLPRNIPECPRCHGEGNYPDDDGSVIICDCRKVLFPDYGTVVPG